MTFLEQFRPNLGCFSKTTVGADEMAKYVQINRMLTIPSALTSSSDEHVLLLNQPIENEGPPRRNSQ